MRNLKEVANLFRNYQIHLPTLCNSKSLSGKANGLCANSNSHLNLYISTWRPRYLIIGHLFILLYCHIILVEIVLCFDALYSGIACITWSYFILYFLKSIYRHHFRLYLAFFYFLFLWLFCFLLIHVVSPIWLRLHVTQEVPLPPYICNRSWHIEDNVDLGWGESWGSKYC